MADNNDPETDPESEHATPELPPSIAAAWGFRNRPGKGPKRALSVRQIVDAAIQAAVTDGLSAVSMNRVASEIGTAAMSLYRYVSGKDELLLLMVDAVAPVPEDIPGPDEHWRSACARWARGLRAIYLANPWVLKVPVSSPPLTPNQVGWMERGLRCTGNTPLSPADRAGALMLLSGYVRNDATLMRSINEGYAAKASSPDAAATDYARMLRLVTDPVRFPAITAILDAEVFDHAGTDEEDFEFGLERILDGVQVLIDSYEK